MEKQNPASIGIYIDDKLDIIFIPTLYTKIGYSQDSGYFKLLRYPYTYMDMGELFIQILNDMRHEPILDGQENIKEAYKIITGGKSFFAFQQKRQMICATFSKEMKFEYWYKKERGFGIGKDDKKVVVSLPLKCDVREIGKAIDDIYFEVNKKHLREDKGRQGDGSSVLTRHTPSTKDRG